MKEQEFTRTVLPLRDRMFRYAQSLLLSRDEAEDAVHDLLERLWRDRDRLDGCRSVASFVMTSVRNACYDHLRSLRARSQRDETVKTHAERVSTDAVDGWEARDLVRRAMAQLPQRQREALHLKEIEGYPTREIAQLLSTDEAQVRTILSRARCAMREILKRMTDDDTKRD
ncbi:RNA polymerase sigma factor [Alistipes sp.]|uniref:RNA polymerase sigma factor n=1 Tax=Alistipes sp. TaxID=1872444 RepID=UPI003AF1A27D